MFGRVMEDDAMGSVGQKNGTRFHRFENAGFALRNEDLITHRTKYQKLHYTVA